VGFLLFGRPMASQ